MREFRPHRVDGAHRCTGVYDEGPILGHTTVAVEPNDSVDTLSGRVLKAEHDLYCRVIAEHFAGQTLRPASTGD